jgi:integrase
MRRRRSVFYNVLQYAVELEKLDYNPIDKVKVQARRKKVVGEVDRRVVVNPRQARELLCAVTYVGRRGGGPRLRAFFAAMYFGALRPAEALGLRRNDCHLPVTCLDCAADLSEGRGVAGACAHKNLQAAWGLLILEKSRPIAGKRWTDSGEAHDDRGLKHRGEDEPREVPIPPELVLILWHHLNEYGAAPDGRLFRSPSGNVVGASTYSRAWEAARVLALTPRQVGSPMAGRPYDLRHAALSLWLNAGVPAPECAERAGQSVEVLLKVYAKCIDGQRDLINQRIEAGLAA